MGHEHARRFTRPDAARLLDLTVLLVAGEVTAGALDLTVLKLRTLMYPGGRGWSRRPHASKVAIPLNGRFVYGTNPTGSG